MTYIKYKSSPRHDGTSNLSPFLINITEKPIGLNIFTLVPIDVEKNSRAYELWQRVESFDFNVRILHKL